MEDPWAVPPPGVWLAHQARRPPSRVDVVIGFERACRSAIDGEALGMLERHRAAQRRRRLLRLGPHRHGREPAGRHQEPGDLRVPGQPGADPRPPRPRGDLPRARPRSGRRPASSRATPSSSTTACGSARSSRRSTRSSTRASEFVTGEVRLHLVAGRVRGHRPAQPAQPLRLRAGHLRRRRQLPPRGLGRLRAPVGPRHRDLGRHPGHGAEPT